MQNVFLFFIVLILLSISCKERTNEALIKSNNSKIDTTAPKIVEIKVKNTLVKAGEKSLVLVHVTDDGSGINTDMEMVFMSEKRNTIRVDNGSLKATNKKNWYSVELDVGKYTPPEDYHLFSINISDKAGNIGDFVNGNRTWGLSKSDSPLVLKVENKGVADNTVPEILTVKMKTLNVKVGEPATVLLKVADDLSGVNLSAHGMTSSGFEFVGGAKRFQLDLQKKWVSLGKNWYSLDFIPSEIRSDLPLGKYRLYYIRATDNVGNTQLIFKGSEGFDYNYLAEFNLHD